VKDSTVSRAATATLPARTRLPRQQTGPKGDSGASWHLSFRRSCGDRGRTLVPCGAPCWRGGRPCPCPDRPERHQPAVAAGSDGRDGLQVLPPWTRAHLALARGACTAGRRPCLVLVVSCPARAGGRAAPVAAAAPPIRSPTSQPLRWPPCPQPAHLGDRPRQCPPHHDRRGTDRCDARFTDWAFGFGDSSLNFVTRTPPRVPTSPTVRSLWDYARAISNAALAVIVPGVG
jgi:hypothetical protein